MASKQPTDGIIEILERQAAALAELADLAQAQRDAARDGNVDVVDRLLDQRRGIVEALAEVENELARIGQQLEQAKAGQGRAGEILNQSRQVARNVAASDAECMAELESQRGMISDQLAENNKGKRAGAAYADRQVSSDIRISA